MSSLIERLLSNSEPEPNTRCRFWLGHLEPNGYARVLIDHQRDWVHRSAYEAWVGPILKGNDVHHTCDIHFCIEPHHLQSLTRSQHKLIHGQKAREARGNKCIHGHDLTLHGRISFLSNGRSSHKCRQCAREDARYYRQRDKGDA